MAVAKKTLDFTNVKEFSGVNPKRMPAGPYAATVVAVDDKKAKDGTDMWRFDCKLQDDPTAIYPYYCKLQEDQLWKLRALLVAGGFNVPKKRMAVDPAKLIGKSIAVVLADDEYDGKEKSVIDGVPFPVKELEGQTVTPDEADEDEPEDDDEVPGVDDDDMEMEIDEM